MVGSLKGTEERSDRMGDLLVDRVNRLRREYSHGIIRNEKTHECRANIVNEVVTARMIRFNG